VNSKLFGAEVYASKSFPVGDFLLLHIFVKII